MSPLWASATLLRCATRAARHHRTPAPASPLPPSRTPPLVQSELGDVVYVELPEVGSDVTKGETFGVVESVKVSPRPAALAARRTIPVGGGGSIGCGTKFRLLCTSDAPLHRSQAASDVYSPVSGTVVEVNSVLEKEPAKVRPACTGPALMEWFRRVNLQSALRRDAALSITPGSRFSMLSSCHSMHV